MSSDWDPKRTPFRTPFWTPYWDPLDPWVLASSLGAPLAHPTEFHTLHLGTLDPTPSGDPKMAHFGVPHLIETPITRAREGIIVYTGYPRPLEPHIGTLRSWTPPHLSTLPAMPEQTEGQTELAWVWLSISKSLTSWISWIPGSTIRGRRSEIPRSPESRYPQISDIPRSIESGSHLIRHHLAHEPEPRGLVDSGHQLGPASQGRGGCCG